MNTEEIWLESCQCKTRHFEVCGLNDTLHHWCGLRGPELHSLFADKSHQDWLAPLQQTRQTPGRMGTAMRLICPEYIAA